MRIPAPVQIRTKPQQTAIAHVHGPLLVVAGAGSGKTTVLSERMARLVAEGKAAPHEILAIAYNRSAAHSLKGKVQAALQAAGVAADAGQLNIHTFHAFCDALLRQHGRHFHVIDETDLKVFLNIHVEELPLDRFIRAANPGEFISELLDFISRCQDEMLDSHSFSAYVDDLESGKQTEIPRVVKTKELLTTQRGECIARCREIANVFLKVEAMLAEKGWGTYGKMISGAVRLLREDAAALAEARQRARFILVDEFQDSNFAQLELLTLLAGEELNIFAVGDPDQAIYKFRGATSAAFDEFKKRFPNAGLVYLDTNFRSTTEILQTAFRSIAPNPGPLIDDGKGNLFCRTQLHSGQDESRLAKGEAFKNEAPGLLVTPDFGTEAHAVVQRIEQLQSATGCGWSGFAVLFRAYKHSDEIVQQLARRNIPFYVHGQNVADCTEVLDLTAAFRAIAGTASAVDFMRLGAMPDFRLDAQSLHTAFARDGATLPAEVLMKSVKGGEAVLKALYRLRERVNKKPARAVEVFELVRAALKVPESHAVGVFRVFLQKWQKGVLAGAGSIAEFCEYLECFLKVGGKMNGENPLEDPAMPPDDSVQLMTIHGAKGLEFDHVFILRCNQAAFPNGYHESLFEFPLALSNTRLAGLPAADVLHKEEERRLFYVALTRARQSLTICGKRKTGNLQAFVKELEADASLKKVLRVSEVTSTFADLEAASPQSVLEQWLHMPLQGMLETFSLSASAIKSYDQCPLSYRLQRIWKVPGEYSAAQQYGAAVHQVLLGYFSAVKAGSRPDDATVMASFEDAMQRARFTSALQMQLYLKQGRKHLAAFVASQAANPLPPVRDLELDFRVEIDGVPVKGRFDRVDDDGAFGVIIEDYKTGRAQDQEKVDKDLQLTVYALAGQAMGWKVSGLRLYNLEDNSTILTTRNQKALDKGKTLIADVAKGIRAGEFEPIVGNACGYCDYKAICPAHEKRPIHPSKAATSIQ